MKKNIIALGLIVAATFALTDCTKEIGNPAEMQESAGVPFEITASAVETKTVNEDFGTAWKAGDELSVFHVETGQTALGSNDQFSISAGDLASKVFRGTLASAPVTGKSYDWHAFYPYNDKYSSSKLQEGVIGYTTYGATCSSGAVSTALKQSGNDSMSHLAGDKFPLYGTVSGVAADGAVSVGMKHLMSVIELEVTNNASDAVTVTEVQFSAPVHVVGSFYYDTVNDSYQISGESYCSKTAKLSVAAAESIAKGGKAKFYLAVVPVDIEEGDITMTVTTDKGTCVKTKTLAADNASDDLVLKAGKIRRMTFAYDAEIVIKTVSLPWTEDFSGTLDDYTVTDGGGTTKIYENDNLAGGEAPEILIAKGSGSLGVNVDLGGKSGFFTLSFKSNKDYINVTSTTAGVTIEEIAQGLFIIDVPANTEILSLSLVNTSSGSNARVDDISLVAGKMELQTLVFKKSSADDAETVTALNAVMGEQVVAPVLTGAKTTVTYSSSNQSVAAVNQTTGALTLVGEGETVITATAAGTSQYIAASASYTLKVTAPLTGNENFYVKVTEAPADWTGKYLIVFGTAAHATLSGKDLIATVSNLLITEDGICETSELSAATFTVEKFGDAYSMKYPDEDKYFAPAHNSSSSSSTAFSLTFNYTDNGVEIGGYVAEKSYYLYSNNNSYYRCYVSKTKDDGTLTSGYSLPTLYKLEN